MASQLVAGIIGSIILAAAGYDGPDDAPMWLYGMLNLPLHATLAYVAIRAARRKGEGPVRDFAIRSTRADVPYGLAVGVLAQFVLVPLVTLPFLWLLDKDLDDVGESARELADRADNAPGVLMLIFTVGAVAPLVEEIFFRGLMLGGYRKRRNLRWLEMLLSDRFAPDTTRSTWNTRVGVIFSSLIFAAVHFQLILMPALFAVGVVFAVLTIRSGRLGPAIWAHVAFNATTLVSLLS